MAGLVSAAGMGYHCSIVKSPYGTENMSTASSYARPPQNSSHSPTHTSNNRSVIKYGKRSVREMCRSALRRNNIDKPYKSSPHHCPRVTPQPQQRAPLATLLSIRTKGGNPMSLCPVTFPALRTTRLPIGLENELSLKHRFP